MAYIDVDEFEYVILNKDIEVNHKCTDLENYVNGANQFRQQMKNAIRKQPTADVVEVVRCDECEHWIYWADEKRCSCDLHHIHTMREDFCSYGERRDT